MLKGYRSIDGGAVVRLHVVFSDVISAWEKALTFAKEIEPRIYDIKEGLYYSVHREELKQGQSYYTFRVELVDSSKVSLFTIHFDIKGTAKVEIRYGAQRDSYYLNTAYRQFLDFLNIKIVRETIMRVDLALTIEKPTSEIMRHIVERRYYSLLSSKNIATVGDVNNPSYVRMGSLQNVEVCIYNKSLELVEQSFNLSYAPKLQDYLTHFGNSENVTRIEYRLGRTYLHNCGYETPDDVNNDLAALWLTMSERYWTPTKQVNDNHHACDIADWWADTPYIELRVKTKTSDNVYYHFASVAWRNKYKMMLSRAQGYLASIAASMARTKDNLDNSMQVLFRRLIEDSEVVYERALSRLALQVVR